MSFDRFLAIYFECLYYKLSARLEQATGLVIECLSKIGKVTHGELEEVFTHHSIQNGWPVLKNVAGYYWYYHTRKCCWHITKDPPAPTQRGLGVEAIILGSSNGMLPVGVHEWWCSNTFDDATFDFSTPSTTLWKSLTLSCKLSYK